MLKRSFEDRYIPAKEGALGVRKKKGYEIVVVVFTVTPIRAIKYCSENHLLDAFEACLIQRVALNLFLPQQ